MEVFPVCFSEIHQLCDVALKWMFAWSFQKRAKEICSLIVLSLCIGVVFVLVFCCLLCYSFLLFTLNVINFMSIIGNKIDLINNKNKKK